MDTNEYEEEKRLVAVRWRSGADIRIFIVWQFSSWTGPNLDP